MATRKRAVNAEQKEARKRTILQAGYDMFADLDYDDVNVASVARRSGIAKGTVYLYFNTKEELFLELCRDAFLRWYGAMEEGLKEERKPVSIPRVVALFADTLEADPEFLRLLAILHSRLEQNVEAETLLAFRRDIRDGAVRLGNAMEEHLDFVNRGEGAVLVIRIQALIIGLQHMAAPPADIASDLDSGDLEIFNINLGSALKETLTVLMMGLKARMRKP